MSGVYESWTEAFTIFTRYPDSEQGVHAEHDVVYAGPHPDVVSEADAARLAELGWHRDHDYECFGHFT